MSAIVIAGTCGSFLAVSKFKFYCDSKHFHPHPPKYFANATLRAVLTRRDSWLLLSSFLFELPEEAFLNFLLKHLYFYITKYIELKEEKQNKTEQNTQTTTGISFVNESAKMSTSSIKPLPTLKGIFNEPKMNHRRDFLRENKLSLRELQRITNKKTSSQQNDQQQKHQKQQVKHQQSQQFYANKRRSSSQQRSGMGGVAAVASGYGEYQPRSISQQRSTTTLKPIQTRESLQPSRAMSRCPSCAGSGNRRHEGTLRSSASIASCNKEIQTEDIHDEDFLYDALKKCTSYDAKSHSSAYPNNFEQRAGGNDPNMPQSNYYEHEQTDEAPAYPYETEQHDNNNFHDGASMRSQVSYMNGQRANADVQTSRSRTSHSHGVGQEDQQSTLRQGVGHINGFAGHGGVPECMQDTLSIRSRISQRSGAANANSGGSYHGMEEPPTARSRTSLQSVGRISNVDVGAYNGSQEAMTARSRTSQKTLHSTEAQALPISQEDDYHHFQNMRIHDDHDHDHDLQAQPQSARSHQTTSTQLTNDNGVLRKKKSTGSVHKLGSRDDIRLPRYLEREKREKEDQRAREMLRDPNCPLGHYQLSEQERLTELAAAENKFKALISELNHMPMTTQTLRIRTRKAEIDKELATIEADIRIFSKPKVYVKQEEYT